MSTPDRGGWNPRSQEFTPQTSPNKSRHVDEQARYQPPHIRRAQVGHDLLVDVDEPRSKPSKNQDDFIEYDHLRRGNSEDDSDDDDKALLQFLYRRAELKAFKIREKKRVPSTPEPSDTQIQSPPPPADLGLSPRKSSDVIHGKYYEGRRLTSSMFSPGYGFRPQGPSEPLPNPEELTGPGWSHHRVYPAPAPIEPAVNQDVGCPADDDQLPPAPAHPQQQPVTPPAEQSEKNADQVSDRLRRVSLAPASGVITPPTSEKGLFSPSVDVPKPSTGSSVPIKTEYVPWDNGVHYQNPALANPFEDENNPYEQRRRERGDAFTNRASKDSGYSAQRPRDNGYATQRPRDDGYASQRGGGIDDAYDSYGSYGEPKRNGGGEGCFNCGQNGHMSRECPEPQRGRGGGGKCYNCDEEGHMSRDCPQPRSSTESRGCYSCGEEGHQARDCPTSSKRNDYGGSGGGKARWGQGNDNNTSNWGESNDNEAAKGWGEGHTTPATAKDASGDDGWGESGIASTNNSGWEELPVQTQSHTRPETARASQGIHPDRLKMLGGEPRASPAARVDYAPNNAPAKVLKARDKPPHMRRAQSPQVSENLPELHVEAPDNHDDGEFGGW